YVGGAFLYMGGQIRRRVAAFDLTTGGLKTWNPVIGGNAVHSLAVAGSLVYIGGDFEDIYAIPTKSLGAVWTTAAPTDFNPQPGLPSQGLDPVIYAIATSGSMMMAGGDFTVMQSTLRDHLAAFDSNALSSWDPSTEFIVHALLASANTV